MKMLQIAFIIFLFFTTTSTEKESAIYVLSILTVGYYRYRDINPNFANPLYDLFLAEWYTLASKNGNH